MKLTTFVGMLLHPPEELEYTQQLPVVCLHFINGNSHDALHSYMVEKANAVAHQRERKKNSSLLVFAINSLCFKKVSKELLLFFKS